MSASFPLENDMPRLKRRLKPPPSSSSPGEITDDLAPNPMKRLLDSVSDSEKARLRRPPPDASMSGELTTEDLENLGMSC